MSDIKKAKELLKRYSSARIPFIVINTMERDRTLEVLKEVRKEKDKNSLGVIVMTSPSEKTDASIFLKNGGINNPVLIVTGGVYKFYGPPISSTY